MNDEDRPSYVICGQFPPCCETHSLPLCPRCLNTIHAQSLVSQEAS